MITYRELIEATKNGWLGFTSPETRESNNTKNLKDSKFVKDGMQLHDKPELTPDEKGHLEGYSTGGYAPLNDFHRDYDEDYYNRPSAKEYLINRTKHIDSAIAKHTTNHPIHVWRGIEHTAFKKTGIGPKTIGKTISDKGYVSTSISPPVAKGFTGDQNEQQLIHIKIPKGSKAIHLLSHGLNYHGKFSDPEVEEHEVLFPRGSKFKHTKTTILPSGGKVHHLTHIPEGSHEDI